ncbi:DNA polymerase III subunit alpha [Oharaeibacter diazotrophicus]|uniref:DNA polymerase III subunit alpha n=1 Tax=Oharaeibacter diazotrophicus TaxID=1920512 RepID=A0A4V3CWJ1_9HYPH|nr:DNA polymerase III subunit alpha [Oharaeibacter diazotrophicus]TDP86608.1 DNA polymerase-3 subunit alpha [Oharaeibacter diazotrophicus]BBE71451.1 DNA polymerase III subunit alpha [Pleomorphomonas sp. SM30]GLS78211.1 DNA-directed DNA polymerase [Oharaeibacter diazotrophicus]
MADDIGFVHLRVHSAYSLLEGALPLSKILKLADADAQPAIAVTDTGNLFSALEFSEKAAEKGIQPIVGCELAVDFGDEPADRRRPGAPAQGLPSIVLIAATQRGFDNLTILVSRSFMETEPGARPHLPFDRLADRADGILALTGGPNGPVDRAIAAGHGAVAAGRLARLAALFGDRLYVELQRHGTPAEALVEPELVALAYGAGLPLVATNECYFPARGDYEAHDALIAIAEGRVIADDDRRRLTPEHYLKSRAEMTAVFHDLPEALANTVEIARRVSYRPRKRKPILPRFAGADVDDVALAEKAEAEELARQAWEGLERRLEVHGLAPGLTVEDYRDRLGFELGIITKMKFPGYFLIVADFIKWAKAHGIPVGPGRGSGAGSLVAWSLTITDLDPMRFALLFERFLNPERVSMPDFDIDFCQDRREEVIRYVQGKYGREQVAQIITFGTLQARAVLRDVGRVLQLPYGQVDKLCKLVPQNPANPVTLGQALEDEPRLKEARRDDPVVDRLIDMAMKLEGLYRHASTHAAGIVIGDRPLDQLVPVYRDPRSDMPVTQYNMKWVESAGLVKFDFLGLKTLTVLETAVKLIARRGISIDLSALPLDDPATYALLSKGETVGVFQLESMGMRKAIADIEPDRFEDIIALVALYRPGPMANIPVYGAVKHGREAANYIHPKLEPVLKETYGIIVYQEQVMQIAQILSGYSLGEADLLRRAMGKKIKAEMDAQRVRFVAGAVKDGLDEAQANMIFDLLAKFADYGFNKSHAAAYALVAYQTAYLKANHPVEFMAASMTLDAANTDKLNDFRREAIRLGIEVVPPSVNRSHVDFEVEDGRILYALGAVKGVGRHAVEHVVEVRGDRPFRDVADFAHRINPKALNKRILESLVAAGAFDGLEPNRARLFEGLDKVMAAANKRLDDEAAGQGGFSFGGPANAAAAIPLPSRSDWLPDERLQREHGAIGFYLSAHPLDAYGPLLERLRVQMWGQFSAGVKRGATAGRLAGTVVARQERKTRTGNKMGILTVSDPTGQYEAVIFSEGLSHYRDLLEPGQSVILLVSAEDKPEGISVRIDSVEPLDQAAGRLQHALRIFLRGPEPVESIHRHLAGGGEGDVSLIVLAEGGRGEVEVRLPGRYKVSPQIAGALRAVPGVVQVELA